MAQPKLFVESFGGSTQISIDGLLQLMILEDGSVQIDLAGKDVEVERSGLQYVVRKEAATRVAEAYNILLDRDDDDVVYGVD